MKEEEKKADLSKYTITVLPPAKQLFANAKALQIQCSGGLRRRNKILSPALQKIVFR